jgi:hypothetical protein
VRIRAATRHATTAAEPDLARRPSLPFAPSYVRVKYANDEESFREKFALIVWIGEECVRPAYSSAMLSLICSYSRVSGSR